ncbi:hypothetical protein [Aliarcobacter cryaerophilus]|uniref:hypothetical protein n=1 Tax=Aliarcobacter cryaerophilus TaxID=28198 RepID=UPI0021B19483|nr:hypothetical protein [Aliarcobacter cryaerophilus]MCT7513885.1 hypothetical protein [Aliarcobacter cryaerophilus]MCT7518274.1 hypothetical protein [Aliarcobacter cryaerophilus]
MEIIKKGFTLKYEILDINMIKVTKAGKNSNFEWNDSLTIRTSNVFQVEDEELGFVDKEEIVEFKFPCESLTQISELNLLFRSLKKAGIVIQVEGFLPRRIENNPILQVTVIDTPLELIQKYSKDLTKKPDTKVS